jgi:beta-glucosidase
MSVCGEGTHLSYKRKTGRVLQMKTYKDTPLWDSKLPLQERLDYLLSEMTIEEKLGFLATRTPALPRLGIGVCYVGGEAAHGVEARHDQDEIKVPEATTSFPQPIGMSATWDPELIRQAGRVTGLEARVLNERHPERGLFRWAPTVDIERDPRWGRTEEGYGEEPYLTGKIASAYVRGMQGDDPDHLLVSSALKHFVANNVEDGRGVKSSMLDARNRNDYYYEPFRRVIEEGHATSLMTAYNAVNGEVCMLDHRVNELIRGKWGLDGHIVCDGGAMSMVRNDRHATASHAETIARSLKAGVDCMTDIPEVVEQAAREAYEKGWITREDVDRALGHTFAVKLRLGLYDGTDTHPWNHVPKEVLDSQEHRQISRKTAEEAVVLLKNDGLLPLALDTDVALIGPLADQWYQDWYGGEPACRTTVLEGVENLTGHRTELANGLDLVYLCFGDGWYGAIDAQGILFATREREAAEVIRFQDWGDGSVTMYVPRLHRYLNLRDDGQIAADKETLFSWFVKECFHLERTQIRTWYGAALCIGADGRISAEHTVEESMVGVPQTEAFQEKDKASCEQKKRICFSLEVIENGIQTAAALAAHHDVAVLVLGCCPVINGKEDHDRPSIQFPPAQRALAQAVFAANPHTALVLIANYPYGLDWEEAHLPAILLSASGSQDLGTAVARTLFGENAPAGRLNMTWYSEKTELPDIDDYDIIRTERTYRYDTGKALYPFGHGLTYSPFSYRDFQVQQMDDHLQVTLSVTNEGTRSSDEVVQFYVRMPQGRTPKPIRQLVGFCRLHDVAPQEMRLVRIDIPREELRYYDVVRQDFLVEGGTYVIEAGASSGDIRQSAEISIPGETPGLREKGRYIPADHWDDYSNTVLTNGPSGTSAESSSAAPKDPQAEAWLIYRDCESLESGSRLTLQIAAGQTGSIEIYAKEQKIATWRKAEETEHVSEEDPMSDSADFTDITLLCGEVPSSANGELRIRLTGEIRLAGFYIESE